MREAHVTSPSAHFRQHHAVDEPRVDAGNFRPAWRVRTRLDQLLIDRSITPHEWFIAVRFRTMLELVAMRQGVRAARIEFLPPGKPNGTTSAQASRYCREIADRFGAVCSGILIACLVDDLSWAELGRRIRVDPRTAKAWTVVLLKMLPKQTP
jgi:hypothetical protein